MTDPLCASWRRVGDPAADALVVALSDRPQWMTVLRSPASNDPPIAGPPELQDLAAAHAGPLPAVRADALVRAARWSERHLPYLSVAMLAASLPQLFLGGDGAQVLQATGRLTQSVDTRINRTGRYVLDVIAPGGCAPCGRALGASVQVRLVHALVRTSIGTRDDGTVPICQQDMLATLFAFSVTPIRSARRLGLRVRPSEADDYYQLWRAVSGALGIEASLVPPSYAQAETTFDALMAATSRPTPAGRTLARVLLDGIARHLQLPGNDELAAWLVRYLVGARQADDLQIPSVSPAARHKFTRWVGGKTLSAVAPVLGRRVHTAIVRHKLRATEATAGRR